MRHATACLVGLSLLVACGGGSSGGGGVATTTPAATTTRTIALQLGADLAPAVAQRVEALIRRNTTAPVTSLAATDDAASLPPGSLLLALGDTRVARDAIPDAELARQAADGFALRSLDRGGVTVLAGRGNPAPASSHYRGGNRGLSYAAYAALEQLGFAFLHPLAPTEPGQLRDPTLGIDRGESPYWPTRSWHLHTMHPLELTELLNGWGPSDPNDEAGWRAMLPEWDLFLEWLLANRQNEVEWVLLHSDTWGAFSDGAERIKRLTELVDRAHAFGIAAGIDVPLALQQQHSWALIRDFGDPADEDRQLRDRLDHVMAAGFDFASTEMGFSEFTKPDDRKMLHWLDLFAEHLETRWGKHGLTKAHVSAGQTAPNFVDPDTGGPLNFNFLTHYAHPRLGVMPHTVQHYALDDPAPTYGNDDFAFMREFLQEQAGTRPTVWFPETAYWVSFDVDVPLFLPIYAERRLHDLRLLAGDELAGRMGRGAAAGSRMDGQSVFSSGWEWGYWLNDVVAARAVWNPRMHLGSDDAALRDLLAEVVAPFGPAAAQVLDLLVETCAEQQRLLIEGRWSGQPPRQIESLNGQGYLQGWDTWDELAEMVGLLPGLGPVTTQPTKRGMLDMRSGILPGPDYVREIAPLLSEMETVFSAQAGRWQALQGQVPPTGRDLFDDMRDAAAMTALRARQVHGLYDYVAFERTQAQPWLRGRLQDARDALDAAAAVVTAREPRYRVPADRIAGWRPNPTAYRFNYLWSVRSLNFWWRDEGKAVDKPWSPAYLNVIDPLKVAFGEGFWVPLANLVRRAGQGLGAGSVTDILAAPDQEPTFPQQGLRQRP